MSDAQLVAAFAALLAAVVLVGVQWLILITLSDLRDELRAIHALLARAPALRKYLDGGRTDG